MTPEDAVELLERIRADVAAEVPACPDHGHDVTISVGVANGDGSVALDERINRTDSALYETKQRRRDQVVLFQTESV